MDICESNVMTGDDYGKWLKAQMVESDTSRQGFLELYMLYLITKNLNLSVQLDDLLGKSLVFFKEYLKIDDLCLMLMDDEGNELAPLSVSAELCESEKGITFKIGEGIPGIAAYTGKPVVVQDVSKDKVFLYHKGKEALKGSLMSVPLISNDGKVMGVLNIRKREGNAFKGGEVVFFSSIANNIAHTIERLKLYEKVREQSIIDDLTTLYTRKYFLEHCYREYSKTKRVEGCFSIILLDIDHFKYFNDTYGHPLGDKALQMVAQFLKASLRQGDIVSRYGGEEFAMLLPETNNDGATVTAEKIRRIIERDSAIEVSPLKLETVTITAGVAAYPDDGKTVEEVIHMADKRLFLGKERGRNRVVSVEKESEPLFKGERRLFKRRRSAIKAIESLNFPQYIEIRLNNNGWNMCNVIDIGKKGVMGVVEHEVNPGGVYQCRVVFNAVDYAHDGAFKVKIAHVREIAPSRFQFGAEIIDELNTWQRLFTLLSR